MPIKTLYFDESGFTGANYLDEAQPFFVVASTDIEPARAEGILKAAFPKYAADEFKFSNIWKNHQGGLTEFGKALGGLEHNAYIYMIDKRFAVLMKIIDFLIEPVMHENGYDFYADGFCWKYANCIHFDFEQLAPPRLYDSLLETYQRFSREPTDARLADLQMLLRVTANRYAGKCQVVWEQMALGAERFHRYHKIDEFKATNDLQVTSVFASVAGWRQRSADDFALIHDATANFFRGKNVWDHVTGNEVPQQVHIGGDGKPLEFPLRVLSTTPRDSKDCRSIQFCDVLAGLGTKLFDTRIAGEERTLLREILKAGAGVIDFNGVRPRQVFPEKGLPRKRNGPDAVDKMMAIMAKRPVGKA